MKKIIIIVFCVVLIPALIFAQKKEQLSYFDGKKTVQLDYNTDFVFVSSTNEQELTSMKTNMFNINKNALVLRTDNISKIVSPPSNFKVKHPDRFWTRLSVESQKLSTVQYLELLGDLQQQNPNLIIAPYAQSQDGEVIGLTNYVLVKLKDQQDFKLLSDHAKRFNLDLIGYNQYMPLWFTLSVRPSGMNILEVSKIFQETGLFQHAEPDLRFKIRHNSTAKVGKLNLVPNDPLFTDQWSLNNTGQNGGIASIDINVEAAWDIETGDPSVVIAIVDEGYEMNHPDLNDNNTGNGFNAMTNAAPSVVFGPHGTACAGIAGAEGNNNLGITGVAYNAGLMSISMDFPNLTFQGTAFAINLAANNGASVISNSWGAAPWLNSVVLNNAITDALNNGRGGLGCVVVFASGNDNGAVQYPANSNPDIITVGAMSPCGERKSFTSCDGENWWGSNFGNQLDVVAPGVLMPTTDRQGNVPDDPLACGTPARVLNDYNPDACIPNFYTDQNYYSRFNGTSSACPIVSGVAALVLSVNLSLTAAEVRDIIESTAQKVRTDLYTYTTTSGRPNGTWINQMGYGVVDAHAAVLAANTCPADLTLNGTETGVQTYDAQNTITSTQSIEPSADISYMAGTEITLPPGFIAKDGTDFHAFLGACKTGTKKQHSTSNQPIVNYVVDPPTLTKIEQSLDEIKLTARPNPFQHVTELSFELEQAGIIDLAIYDLNGRQIKQLAKGELDKGTHQFVWNVKELPSGIYLARLVAGNQIQTIKLVVGK